MDELRFRVRGFDLPPQFLYVAVDGAVGDEPFVGVDIVHELLTTVNASRIGDEELQQLELNSREFQVMAMKSSLVTLFVENKSLGLNRPSIVNAAKTALTRAITSRGLNGLQM